MADFHRTSTGNLASLDGEDDPDAEEHNILQAAVRRTTTTTRVRRSITCITRASSRCGSASPRARARPVQKP